MRWLLLLFGCQAASPCARIDAQNPLVMEAAKIRIDVYADVGCDGARPAMGTPQLSKSFDKGQEIAVDVGAGPHTVALYTLDASGRETGSACARGNWSAGSTVCVNLPILSLDDLASVDLLNASGDAGCVCEPKRECQSNQKLEYSAGMCVANACQYPPPKSTICPQGCYAGDCTSGLTTVDPAQAFVAGSSTSVALTEVTGAGSGGGTAPSSSGVEVRVGFVPRGTGRALTLKYSLDGNFAAQTSLALMFKDYEGSDREVWSATIPAQASGAKIYFFVEVHAFDNTVLFAPGAGKNYEYGSQ
jgi:hypothetical protein